SGRGGPGFQRRPGSCGSARSPSLPGLRMLGVEGSKGRPCLGTAQTHKDPLRNFWMIHLVTLHGARRRKHYLVPGPRMTRLPVDKLGIVKFEHRNFKARLAQELRQE